MFLWVWVNDKVINYHLFELKTFFEQKSAINHNSLSLYEVFLLIKFIERVGIYLSATGVEYLMDTSYDNLFEKFNISSLCSFILVNQIHNTLRTEYSKLHKSYCV